MKRAALAESILPPIVALAVVLVAGDLLIITYGQSPAAVWRTLLEGTWGNSYGFGQVLYKATTLTCTGLAVAVGLRAGLFNIGAEGQLAAGGFGAGLVGLLLPAGTPAALAIPACVLAAITAGGAVGSVPGVLRATFGAHEVIVTIMLNFIVLALLNYFVSAKLHVPETLHTPQIHAGMIPRLSGALAMFHGSAANWSLLIVLLAAAAAWWFLFRMRGGYELRAVGLQAEAAEYAGIRTARVWRNTLTMSGALAGLGGINFVLGYKHYYEDGFTGGAGFLGIAVALVGRNDPFGVVIAALFFATLSQGIVILAIAAAVPEVRRVLRDALKSNRGG
jgi:simple sugar transport system permease protein